MTSLLTAETNSENHLSGGGLGNLAARGDSRALIPGLDQSDRLANFNPIILAIRWSTAVACVALAAPAFTEPDLRVVPWVAAIVANTAIRTVQPLEFSNDTRSLMNLLFEVGITVLAVTLTGFWHSPLVFALVSAITIAGFAKGFAFALRIGAASAAAVSLPGLSQAGWTSAELKICAEWTLVLLLIGVVAGFGRRVSGEASRQQSLALSRLSDLSDANALLHSLHRVTQTLPASLDLEEVLQSTLTRVRSLVDLDSAGVFTIEETNGTWVLKNRLSISGKLVREESELPAGVRQAIKALKPVVKEFDGSGDDSLGPDSKSAVYAPLIARDNLIGLIAVESKHSNAYTVRDREVMLGFAEPVALAIDNARWFSRLRTVGADEERSRIARDLHDRIGQSLAYLGFELDRVIRKQDQGEDLADPLDFLRQELRNVVGEVRDTLYDLRTDVAKSKDFASTIEEFGTRVAERSSIELKLDCQEGRRLPILQEREMWRIAQEALINVERHAEANCASIKWRCNGVSAVLEIVDDGIGFPADSAGRPDSYGILGMRERASSVGASLEIDSNPGEGTTVRCYLTQE